LTGSNDGTIAVIDLSVPDKPRLVQCLDDHQDFISSIDCDNRRMVSVSVDNVLKVWSLVDFKCKYSAETGSPTLKVALSWPLAATGGDTQVVLWNVELFYPVRRLQMSTMGNLSSLAMTCFPPQEKVAQNGGFSGCGAQHTKMAPIFIAVGDNQGYISLWDTSAILAGYSSETAHRIVQIGDGGNLISALTLDQSTLISADWAGQVLSWSFG